MCQLPVPEAFGYLKAMTRMSLMDSEGVDKGLTLAVTLLVIIDTSWSTPDQTIAD
jgi:hypothetical protein